MREFDHDKDGYIELFDLESGKSGVFTNDSLDSDAYSNFDKFDADNDGKVNAEDVYNCLEREIIKNVRQ